MFVFENTQSVVAISILTKKECMLLPSRPLGISWPGRYITMLDLGPLLKDSLEIFFHI